MTSHVFLILKEFEGLIGAILGSISTLMVTHWLKNSGKLIFDVKHYNKNFYVQDDYGQLIDAETLNEDGYAELSFEIDIYNTSESLKVLNNIHFEFIDDNNTVIHSGKLKDLDTRRLLGGMQRYDELEFMNCNPKELSKKKLQINFNPTNILLLEITKNIFKSRG